MAVKLPEFESDAWGRFERAVDAVSKSGPRPKAANPQKQSKERASPSDAGWLEWGYHVSPETLAESSSEPFPHQNSSRTQWIPRLMSRETEEGIEIFLS